jgi:hypothetical protein
MKVGRRGDGGVGLGLGVCVGAGCDAGILAPPMIRTSATSLERF